MNQDNKNESETKYSNNINLFVLDKLRIGKINI